MSETITIKKSTYKTLVAILIVALMGISFSSGFILGGSGSTGAVVGDQPTAAAPSAPTPSPSAPGAPSAPTRVQVSADDDPFIGDENAPVTIIEFSDFECPFCGRFYSNTLPQLEQQYIDTGKVKLVYRDFPLSFHPQATPAAEAAECANEQGKFWEFHDLIFENQGIMSPGKYTEWAADLGLDTQQFSDCVSSRKYQNEVQSDFQAGSGGGVSGTPSFFIGTDEGGYELVVGAQPFSVFKQKIDALIG